MSARWLPLFVAVTSALSIVPGAPALVTKTLVLALGAGVLAAVALVGSRHGTLRVNTPIGVWGLLSLWSVLGLFWGNPGGASRLLLLLLGLSFAVAVAHRLRPPERRRLFEGVAVLVGLAIAAAVFLGRLMGTDWAARIIGNENWHGVALSLTLASSAGAALQKRGRLRGWWTLAAGVQLAALIATPSRVAWAAAAAACAMLVAWRLCCRGSAPSRARAARRLATALVSSSLLLTAVGVALPRSAPSWGGAAARSLEGRSWIWKVSAAAAARRPSLGSGSGNFGHAYLPEQGRRLSAMPVREASRRFVNATTAHNDFLHVGVEHGLVGIVLLSALLWLLCRRALERSPAQSAMLAAFGICMVGESCLTQPVPVVFLALSTAALSPRTSRWPVAVAFASGAVGSALLVQAMLSERALTAADSHAGLERFSYARHAAAVNPRSGEAALTHGLSLLELGRAKQARVELQRSTDLLANAGTHVALGNACQQLDELDPALRHYRVALSQHPALLKALANEAMVLVRLGRLAEARDSLLRAQGLWPGHAALPPVREALRHAELDHATGFQTP